MARKRARGKSHVTAMELKIHRKMVFVYVRRDSDQFRWRVYQRASLHSVMRIARVAAQIVTANG